MKDDRTIVCVVVHSPLSRPPLHPCVCAPLQPAFHVEVLSRRWRRVCAKVDSGAFWCGLREDVQQAQALFRCYYCSSRKELVFFVAFIVVVCDIANFGNREVYP